MTEKNARLADIWVESFKFSRGFLEPQGKYLKLNLTAEELDITSTELLSDQDALCILIPAYRAIIKYHHYCNSPDEKVIAELRDQINLARSQAIHGELGLISD